MVDALDANKTNNADFNTFGNVVTALLNQKVDTDYVDNKVGKLIISILAEEKWRYRYGWAFGSGPE